VDPRGTSAGPPDGLTWTAAWTAALDELELTLDQTEELLGGADPVVPAPWSPPQLAAPLPPELLARAQDLLARQREVMAQTATAMSGARQSLALVGKVADAGGARRPAHAVYLDVRA
jgi:hypothetical protein